MWHNIFRKYIGITTVFSSVSEKNVKFIFAEQLKTFERKAFFKERGTKLRLTEFYKLKIMRREKMLK